MSTRGPDANTYWTDEWIGPGPKHLFNSNRSDFAPRIDQGSLGDCWLLASLQVVPLKYLKSIIRYDRVSSTFIITLKVKSSQADGRVKIYQVDVRVDGKVPCKRLNDGSWVPVYVRNEDPTEIWAPIIEKAFAKLMKGTTDVSEVDYKVLDGGNPANAFQMITGWPVDSFDLRLTSQKDLWNKISHPDCEIGVAGTYTLPNGQEKYRGIVKGHAYSIMGTTMIDGVPAIKLRNPWGHQEWSGTYRDDKDDGIFYMPFSEFTRIFSLVSLCYLPSARRSAPQLAPRPATMSVVVSDGAAHPNWVPQAEERPSEREGGGCLCQ